MDRLNRHVENQIKVWVFQKEHAELAKPGIYASYDSLQPAPHEHVEGSSDEQYYSRF